MFAQFDDILNPSTTNDANLKRLIVSPVPFPYHRFFFSDGFGMVSRGSTPFGTSGSGQIVRYDASLGAVGQIGVGPLRENSCFRFNFKGMRLGCNSKDHDCVFHITGLVWNGTEETPRSTRTLVVGACAQAPECSLSRQTLDLAAASEFVNLTAVNISMTVGGKEREWWGDDVQLSWTDNECATAECRAQVPNTSGGSMTERFSAVRSAKKLLRRATRGHGAGMI